MSDQITLSSSELFLMSDADVLHLKRGVQEKIFVLLQQVQDKLSTMLPSCGSNEFMSKINTAKISRGENYKGLPYLVLDYPSVFTKNNILAFRTMFYWGNFFSITLHLQGDYLTLNRVVLHSKIAQLQALELFISTGNSPWQYHYSSDNYLPLSQHHKEKISTDPFIKLSQRIPLNEYASLPDKAASFVRTFLEFLRTE